MNFNDYDVLDHIIYDFVEFLAILRIDKRLCFSKKFALIHKYLRKMQKEYKNLINEDL